jgi:nucleoside-diphosphate-sugar epimerase
MKILVTGGTGFLGKTLALRLLKLGYSVTVLGRNLTVGRELEEQGILFFQANLADSEKIINACAEQSIVFHCAALSAPWGRPKDFYNANVLGTRSITQGCLRHDVKRLIHVSSPSIYFDMTDRLNIKETDSFPALPVNHYAHTKRLAEEEVDQASAQGLPVVTIRPRALFGPGDQTILPRLIRANQRLGIPMIDNGHALIDLTYIDNAVDALLCCIDSPGNTLGKKYNITNGTPTHLSTVLQSLFQKLNLPFRPINIRYPIAYAIASLLEGLSCTVLMGKEPLFTRYTIGVLAKSQTFDISEARNELGYKPVIGIDEGLDLFADWWKAQVNGY